MLSDGEYRSEIQQYLDQKGFPDALMGTDGETEVCFTDGMRALEGRLFPETTAYVEIGIPRGRPFDLLGRTLVGTRGCRYILDEMFNNIIRFRCGQPTEIDYRPDE